jgi:ribosomal protein S18 acetylase RimI-like enzyme
VPAVRRLLVETWHATYDATLGAGRVTEITNTRHAIPVLHVQIEEPGCCFLIAEQAGAIVGHINTREQPEHTLYLGRLYVHPTSQRQGIGRCLLRAALGRHPTATRVWLTVAADNAPAIAFSSSRRIRRRWRGDGARRTPRAAHGAQHRFRLTTFQYRYK